MKILSVLSRYRLLLNVFVLAIALAVLAFSPVAAQEDEEIVCSTPEDSCVRWDIDTGCTQWMICCVHSADDWVCVQSPAD